MGIKTNIGYCDSTLNLMMGCDGCELSGGHCYAQDWVGRHAGKPGWPASFDKPKLFVDRMEQALAWPDLTGTERPDKPWLNGMPRIIFLNDLGDAFTPSLPLGWMGDLVCQMAATPHVYLILTKQSARFAQFVEWWQMQYCERFPRNIWGGVSVTGHGVLGRVKDLSKIDLAVRFVSFEPLLGPVDLRPLLKVICLDEQHYPRRLVDWAIAGGESGRNARPCHPDWARRLRDDCQAAGVAYFWKQWGEWMPTASANYAISKTENRHGNAVGVAILRDGRKCFMDNGPSERKTVVDQDAVNALNKAMKRNMPDPNDPDQSDWLGYQWMHRVGKKAAGRVLDGREWSEMPQPAKGGVE
jgi:protein gp37